MTLRSCSRSGLMLRARAGFLSAATCLAGAFSYPSGRLSQRSALARAGEALDRKTVGSSFPSPRSPLIPPRGQRWGGDGLMRTRGRRPTHLLLILQTHGSHGSQLRQSIALSSVLLHRLREMRVLLWSRQGHGMQSHDHLCPEVAPSPFCNLAQTGLARHRRSSSFSLPNCSLPQSAMPSFSFVS